MRVLIYEQWQGGHYYNYLENIIPRVSQLVDEVIVTISGMAYESETFKKKFKSIMNLNNVTFQPILSEEDPSLPIKDRMKLLDNLYSIIKYNKPDYVMVPSADSQNLAQGLLGLINFGRSPLNTPIEVTFHNGYGPDPKTIREKFKEVIYKLSYVGCTWDHMNFVNAHYFDDAKLKKRRWVTRACLIPDPVSEPKLMSRLQARSMLGIPLEGKYIGLLGSLDSRNNIPQFIKAFAKASLPHDHRLLLAGKCSNVYERLINSVYSDFIESKRIIFINRFLTDDEVRDGYQALDVCCIPRTNFPGLSSLALKSVASSRPLLVHDFGWSSYITKKFNLGHVCDMKSVESFADAIAYSLHNSDQFSLNLSAKKLLKFHSVENFSEHMIHRMVSHFDIPHEDKRLLWDSVRLSVDDGWNSSLNLRT